MKLKKTLFGKIQVLKDKKECDMIRPQNSARR